MSEQLRKALDDAIYDAAVLRTESVRLTASDARRIRDALAVAPSTPEPGIEHDCEWRRQVDDADETSAKLSQRLLRCQDELRAARLASKDRAPLAEKEQT